MSARLHIARWDCVICGTDPKRSKLCSTCARAWDKRRTRDDGTILAAMAWSANRAHRFAAQRAKKDKAKLLRIEKCLRTMDDRLAAMIETLNKESWEE